MSSLRASWLYAGFPNYEPASGNGEGLTVRRFTKSEPCPICGGCQEDPRGEGKRCHGVRFDDKYAHCTREEYAHGVPFNAGTQAYPHRLNGDCKCGVRHDPAPVPSNGHRSTHEKKVVKKYRWKVLDEPGRVVEHVRLDFDDGSKEYPWYTNGKPGLNGFKKADLPLYGVGNLKSAEPGSTVVLVEGEKACDALNERGILAVAAVTGAPACPSEGTLRPLRDYDVVTWADADDPGAELGKMEATALAAMGTTVRMLSWPEAPHKGDAYDFFAMGGTAEQAMAMIKAAPRWDAPAGESLGFEVVTHDDLLGKDFPAQRWVLEGLIVDDGLTMLGAKKKMGKTWMVLQIAQAVADGTSVLGRKASQGSVIYLCLEDGQRRLQGRLQKQRTKPGLPITYITRFEPLDGKGFAQLKALIQQRVPRLVIIDTLAAAKTAKTDENAAGDMGDLLGDLRRLAQDTHCSILVVAHHGKASYGDPGNDIRGSSAVGGAADVNIGLYKVEDSTARILKAEGRDLEETELRIIFDAAETWSWQLVGDARQIARNEADQDVLGALAVLGEADAGAVARETGKARPSVIPVLKRLAAEGKLATKAFKEGKVTKVVYTVKGRELPDISNTTITPNMPDMSYTVNKRVSDGVTVSDVSGISVAPVTPLNGACDYHPGPCETCDAQEECRNG